MSFWVLAQVLINLLLFAGMAVFWVRLSRPAKDDPRLSKGLQLLQSKISVLEDLSDRTETQVSQLTAILETKCRELQGRIADADRQIARIEQSAQKSLEVAKIFQDRIPHDEIIERQKTIKYVKAARLAHQGMPVEEIAKQVDLGMAEIEMIAKVNREQLQFSEADLPEWARLEASPASSAAVSFHLPREEFQSDRRAPEPARVEPTPTVAPAPVQTFVEIDLMRPSDLEAVESPAASAPTARDLARPAKPGVIIARAPQPVKAQNSRGQTVEVRPFSFPRVESERV